MVRASAPRLAAGGAEAHHPHAWNAGSYAWPDAAAQRPFGKGGNDETPVDDRPARGAPGRLQRRSQPARGRRWHAARGPEPRGLDRWRRGSGGSSLAGAAAKVSDWCAILPADLIAKFAPGSAAPAAGIYPGECGASNGTAALDFRYSTGFGAFEIPSDAETVSGLGQAAYLDRPTADEVELWVALQVDPEVYLFIDMAGHDGKDHKADAVAVAQAILAKLH